LGIGRGAGNLELENFLFFLKDSNYKPELLFQLVANEYADMKKKYQWGPNTAYTLAGFSNIHQNYVFELLSIGRYSLEEITNMIYFISQDQRSASYSLELLNEAIVRRFQHNSKTSSFKHRNFKFLNLDDVLVVGRGQSAINKSEGINSLIAKKSLTVFECNYIPEIIGEKNYCFSVKYNSFIETLDELLKSKKESVIGFPEISSDVVEKVNIKEPIYLPYKILSNRISCSLESGISIPYDVVSMYVISTAVALGVKKIYVAGFDGYKNNQDWLSQRMEADMEDFFNLLKQNYPEVEIISVTPTTYNIKKCSLYYLLNNL